MSNVKFLRGTQASFDKLTAFNEGAFYLTSDTNRLYYANSSTKASYLNKYIYSVANETALRSKIDAGELKQGDFAYLTEENALMVMESNTSAKQVNSYKNDTIKTTGLGVSKKVADGNITFTYALSQQKYDNKGAAIGKIDDISGSFTIAQSDIAQIVTATSVGVTAEVASGTATIKTSGIGASEEGITITGAGSVSVSGTKDALTITGTNTKYTFSAANNNLTLTANDQTGSSGAKQNIAISSGNDAITATAANNAIDVTHKAYKTTNDTSSSAEGQHAGITDRTFTAITSIDGIDKGHITGYTTTTYDLPVDKDTYNTAVEVATVPSGGLQVTVRDSEGAHKEGVLQNGLYFTIGDHTDTKYYNQGALPVYTKDEIETKIKGINAMTYKGIVSSTKALPTNVSIGDTFMVAEEGSYGDHQCKVSDLLIAISVNTEGKDMPEKADGYIDSRYLKWTYVPSGKDVDTTYKVKTSGATETVDKIEKTYGKIDLTASTGSQDDNSSVNIKSGTDVTVTGDINSITIAHATKATDAPPAVDQSISNGGNFEVVQAITTDNGHVSGITTKKIILPTLKDTKYTLKVTDVETNSSNIRLNDGSANQDIGVTGDGYIVVTGTATTNNRGKIALAHKDYDAPIEEAADSEHTTKALSLGDPFKVVTGVETEKGHVKKYFTQNYTLPNNINSTYKFDTALTSDNKSVLITDTLSATAGPGVGDKKRGKVRYTSDSLTIKGTAAATTEGENSIAIDLVWGSFDS